jgi:predicted anti-sigma-YlaC factor YlaD
MKCDEIRERMPEVAAGFGEPTADEGEHLENCGACAEQLKAMRVTMALLDEWQVPETSPYFDVRLQARLREEMAKPAAGWFQWFRRPVMAAALTVLLGVGVGLFVTRGRISDPGTPVAEVGTAVSDLQTLDKNHEMYSDFELLDDLDLQQDVAANP